MRIKINFLQMIIVVFIIFCSSVAFGAEKAKKALETPDLILKMCQSDNIDTSLSGMMLSVDLLENKKIIEYISSVPDYKNQKWANAVKYYALANLTFENNDNLKFINSLPEDEAEFKKMIDFESKLFRHPPSKMLVYLVELAETGRGDNQEIKDRAREKIKKLHPVSDGWVAEFLSSSNYTK